MEDPDQSTLKEGIEFMVSSRYRGRKAQAKQHFNKVGGYEDVERARATPPEGMDSVYWDKAVNLFTSEKHMQRSEKNKICRSKQVIKNRGGTSSYSSTCYKKSYSRVQVFHDAHCNKDGTFDDPLVEQQYSALVEELQQETERSASSGTPINQPAIFKKVLGSRRGHIKGIGHKGAQMSSSTGYSGTSHHTHREEPNQLDLMMFNPRFRATMNHAMQAYLAENQNQGNDENEDNEDDDGSDD